MFYNETVLFFPLNCKSPSQPYCDARGQQSTTCIRPVTPANDDNLGVNQRNRLVSLKQKANTKKASSQGGTHPMHTPPRSTPDRPNMNLVTSLLCNVTNHLMTGPLGNQ